MGLPDPWIHWACSLPPLGPWPSALFSPGGGVRRRFLRSDIEAMSHSRPPGRTPSPGSAGRGLEEPSPLGAPRGGDKELGGEGSNPELPHLASHRASILLPFTFTGKGLSTWGHPSLPRGGYMGGQVRISTVGISRPHPQTPSDFLIPGTSPTGQQANLLKVGPEKKAPGF